MRRRPPVLRATLFALRALILVLALPLMSSGTLPSWAKLFGAEVHVCHCSVDHHDCVCAHCNTDPDAPLLLTDDSLKGRCGDDDVGFAGKALISLGGPPELEVAPALVLSLPPLSLPELLTEHGVPPPTPPPKA